MALNTGTVAFFQSSFIFSSFFTHKYCGLIFCFAKLLTRKCSTKILRLKVAKLRQNFGLLRQNCNWILSLFSSPVLMVDARSFQALAASLDWYTHLTSISYCYRSNARQDKFRLHYCECQNYEIMMKSVVGGQPKQHANPSCKATEAHWVHFSNLNITGSLVGGGSDWDYEEHRLNSHL